MKRRLSQLFFVLSQPKLSVNFNNFIFTNVFFNEIIVILYYMHCFWRNTPTYLPTNLIHSETCLMKNHKSTVDLFLTNKPKSFFKTHATETGLSDYHKLISTFFKYKALKLKPKVIFYRNEFFFTRSSK